MAQLVFGSTKQTLSTECVLGRHRSCGLRLIDDKASRQHARVFLLEGDWWVEDLKSANGTRLNGKRLTTPCRMANGDRITIGNCEVALVTDAVPTAAGSADRIPDDMIGRTIGGYRIDGLIGKGVTGTIYTATQLALERGVAFKIMDPRLTSADPAFAERFTQTINLAASLHHDGLVKIHECGHDQGLLWYTMELVHGDTLDHLLSRDKTLEPSLALMIVEKAADALLAAHAVGLAHGDVKPATVMLTESGHVKILDIGVIGLTAQQARTVQGEAATKQVFYLAPDQARGGKPNVSGDVYSLGCVLFHALAGRAPFAGRTFEEVVKAHETQPVPAVARQLALAPAVDQVLGQMMAKNPEWRYESMQEVKNELHKLRENIAPDAASEEAEQAAREKIAVRARLRTERRRHQSLHTTVMALVVIGIVVAAAAVFWPELQGIWSTGPASPPNTTVQAGEGGVSGPTVGVREPLPGRSDPLPGNDGKDPLVPRWQEVTRRIDDDIAHNDWGAAELTIRRFSDDVSTGARQESPVINLIRLREGQIVTDGDAWYQRQVQQLPGDADATGLAKRLGALASLRDVTISSNRSDAEARYQETLAKLTQRLSEARRQARQAIEAGHFDALAPLAKGLQPAFAGTPVVGLLGTFAAQVGEVAAIKDLWHGDWPTTKALLAHSHGAASLPSAAALILAGDMDGLMVARRLLNDPALSTPELLKRKERVLGRAAAILAFKDPSDLQFIETTQGDPRLQGGALRGEEPCGISCTVPIGGPTWSAAVSLNIKPLGGQAAEAVISCVGGGEGGVVMRIGADAIHCLVRASPTGQTSSAEAARAPEDVRFDRPSDGGRVRIRLSCRDDVLEILVNDQPLGSWSHPAVPPGSQFRCEFGGLTWAIDDMQVIAGE